MNKGLAKIVGGIMIAGSMILGGGNSRMNNNAYGGNGSNTILCNLYNFNAQMEKNQQKKIVWANLANYFCMLSQQDMQRETDDAQRDAAKIRADGERDAARIRAGQERGNQEKMNEGINEQQAQSEFDPNWTNGLSEAFACNSIDISEGDVVSWGRYVGIKQVFREDEHITLSSLFNVRGCNLCGKKLEVEILGLETEKYYSPDRCRWIIDVNSTQPNIIWNYPCEINGSHILKKLSRSRTFTAMWKIEGITAQQSTFSIIPYSKTCQFVLNYEGESPISEGGRQIFDLSGGKLYFSIFADIPEKQNVKVILSSYKKNGKKLGGTIYSASAERIIDPATYDYQLIPKFATNWTGMGSQMSSPPDYVDRIFLNGTGDYIVRAEFPGKVKCSAGVSVVVPKKNE